MITGVSRSAHSLSLKISHIFSPGDWWLTAVYGPHHDQDKPAFISELCEVRSRCIDLWLVSILFTKPMWEQFTGSSKTSS
jgi:hypothetical protein